MASIKATNKSITQRLTRIENAIKNRLNTFYKKKIKPLSYLPIEAIRKQYESEVKNLIRRTIQEAYLIGTDVVAEKVSDKNNEFIPFISITDINNIASLANKLNDQFWKTADRLVRREQEFILNENKELEKKKGFDTEAAILAFAVSAAYLPFNNAVISKTKALTIDTTVDLEVGFDILRLEDANLTGRVMFLTREDAKVDPEICEPLNRTVYDINDPDIPIPIQDTHIHCRCRLIPVVDESSV